MKPETLRDVIRALPCDGATTLAFLGALPRAILDATVYHSCPKCGGAKEYWVKDGAAEFPEPCDCKDAPTAIVEAVLREKADRAIEAVFTAHRTGFGKAVRGELLDTVLSTVLGQVRSAKEILYNAHTDTDGDACATVEYFINDDPCDYKGYRTGGSLDGDIAILEEAGKEE